MADWIKALEDWQTLVSGVLAIGAAMIGGRYINRQIRQTDELEDRRWRRRLLAARSVMPLTLSGLAAWTRDAAEALRGALAQCSDGHLPREARLAPVPPPPAEAIAALERIVEAAGDERVADAIALLLSELQVFTARSSEVAQRRAHHLLGRRDLEGYVLDLAEIHALISDMFDYARGASETIPPLLEPDSIRSGVRMLDFLGDERLEAAARERWDRYACRHLREGTGTAAMIDTLVERNPEMVMRRFDVVADGDGYVRAGHRYDRLHDAVAYGASQAAKALIR